MAGGTPERFLLSAHRSTKSFVDVYEYIRIYLLQDVLWFKVTGAVIFYGACFLSV